MRPLGPTRRHALAGLASLALAGCAPRAAPLAVPLAPGTPRKAQVAGVPLIVQRDYYCGPAALAMVLQWAGQDVGQDEIAAQAFTPGARGTYLADMLGAARRRGMLAVDVSGLGGIMAEVAAGHPVIVFQNIGLGWLPQWHYGVVTGYDTEAGTVVLHSGQKARWVMPVSGFLRSWEGGDRWAVTVLPPDRLPASTDEVAVLRAAAALERAGRPGDAAAAYRAGMARWPMSWLWPFGLGNALYAEGDLNGAQAAFRRAAALNPAAPEPAANLASVTAELAA